ncbi:MAG: hypothetical protein DYG98_01185 [Haliscomenobacteraceae bacterium CHB4]|nr:hypothetical protein [Haliscomenobacteraceae bacterium CHB4]
MAVQRWQFIRQLTKYFLQRKNNMLQPAFSELQASFQSQGNQRLWKFLFVKITTFATQQK